MGENSDISWTQHTFNPWVGCTQVSPACDACYAMVQDHRWGHDRWGKGKPRERTSVGNWRKPISWNKRAGIHGVRERVFCASLADVFDDEVDPLWRIDLWALIRATPNLDWLLLTKRPHNIQKMLPSDWGTGFPNVWLGTTAEDQRFADIRIPALLKVPAVVHFVSMEPLLGPVDIHRWTLGNDIALPADCTCGHGHGFTRCPNTGSVAKKCHVDGCVCPGFHRKSPGLDWIICGGESGTKARLMDAEWARSLRDQCARAGVAFHFKQAGKLLGQQWGCSDSHGGDMSAWPAEFNVREYPTPRR